MLHVEFYDFCEQETLANVRQSNSLFGSVSFSRWSFVVLTKVSHLWE